MEVSPGGPLEASAAMDVLSPLPPLRLVRSPQMPQARQDALAKGAQAELTGQGIARAGLFRRRRADPRSPVGERRTELSVPRHAASACHVHMSQRGSLRDFTKTSARSAMSFRGAIARITTATRDSCLSLHEGKSISVLFDSCGDVRRTRSAHAVHGGSGCRRRCRRSPASRASFPPRRVSAAGSTTRAARSGSPPAVTERRRQLPVEAAARAGSMAPPCGAPEVFPVTSPHTRRTVSRAGGAGLDAPQAFGDPRRPGRVVAAWLVQLPARHGGRLPRPGPPSASVVFMPAPPAADVSAGGPGDCPQARRPGRPAGSAAHRRRRTGTAPVPSSRPPRPRGPLDRIRTPGSGHRS
ncbi:hypothetical protein SCANM63S_07250 [Streptomyces canarius]